MIVKVQIALNSEEPRVMIYSKKHEIFWEGEAIEAHSLVKSLYVNKAVSHPKAYFKSEIKDGKIVLGDQVEYQPW